MGKGDQRTRRGKIYRGTYGKRRPRKKSGIGASPENTKTSTKTKTKRSTTSSKKATE